MVCGWGGHFGGEAVQLQIDHIWADGMSSRPAPCAWGIIFMGMPYPYGVMAVVSGPFHLATGTGR